MIRALQDTSYEKFARVWLVGFKEKRLNRDFIGFQLPLSKYREDRDRSFCKRQAVT